MQHRNRLVTTSALAAGAAALLLLVHATGARADQRAAGARWEYGELTIVGNDAVFWMRDQSFYLEGPEARTPERVTGRHGLNVVQPARVIHLNALGAEGWEVVQAGATPAGEAFLLRRPF